VSDTSEKPVTISAATEPPVITTPPPPSPNANQMAGLLAALIVHRHDGIIAMKKNEFAGEFEVALSFSPQGDLMIKAYAK
jgi:hypothetical protein